ncbi:hypothetical protein LAZ67_17001887 [Cordylochernes scorpioides]|uniref:GIY-YIG domain-containing protein n=1 Tax=Cordylochernes scorpioides TaxID=51811 RepID=A0ABY6LII1_9ARAC|nr:hypothetical protein LAZ67_17001887 [Cordylochernes scorpioides]
MLRTDNRGPIFQAYNYHRKIGEEWTSGIGLTMEISTTTTIHDILSCSELTIEDLFSRPITTIAKLERSGLQELNLILSKTSFLNLDTRFLSLKEIDINQGPPEITPIITSHYTCYLPYTESTITIARKLKSFGIKTIFRGSPSIASILRNPITKSTDQKQKKDLVYQILCLNCNSVYIGETSRDLSIRIKEHQRNISKLNPNSLIVDHARETGHTPDFNNTRILHKKNAKTKTQRLILEAIETMKHLKPLNKSIQLPSQYVPLLS